MHFLYKSCLLVDAISSVKGEATHPPMVASVGLTRDWLAHVGGVMRRRSRLGAGPVDIKGRADTRQVSLLPPLV